MRTPSILVLIIFIVLIFILIIRFSKIIPSFFVDKASCTRQFESELSLHSLASLFPIKKGFFLPLRLSCKESSTFSPSPSSSGSGDVTALRCSEPLRYKVGGPIKGLAKLCGMGPPESLPFILSYCIDERHTILILYNLSSFSATYSNHCRMMNVQYLIL